MKQIDLGPEAYKRGDPATGQMQYPLNRKMLRWMAVVVLAMLIYSVAAIGLDGGPWASFLGMGILAFGAGAAIGLSLTPR